MQADQFQCSKCEIIYNHKDDLIIHEHEDHVETISVTNVDEITDDHSEESFPCVSCSKVFTDLDSLDDHYAETAHDLED